MISQSAAFYANPATKQYYACIHNPMSFSRNVYIIPDNVVQEARSGLKRRQVRLYRKLKEMDHDFFVLVEFKPGEGFRKVVPANPTYNPEGVRELRNRVLEEIERKMANAIQVTYQIDPKTAEMKVFLEYPGLTGHTEQAPLTPYNGSVQGIYQLQDGLFTVISDNGGAQ